MEFREATWAQQLHYQRLLHGAGAEVTERSLPNYPGAALREIIRQSGHPQNVEPLLLTLARPQNAAMRRRFAEVAGELVLVQKVTSAEPVVQDTKMAVHGRILEAPEGMLYPTEASTTTYETWLRVEMLHILAVMVDEGVVRSLVPEMQVKLLGDLLDLAGDAAQPELVRLYAFLAAAAQLRRQPAARAAARAAGLAPKAAAFLAWLLAGPHPQETTVFGRDPFEEAKALSAAVQVLYLLAATSDASSGDLTLPAAGAGKAAKAAPQGGARRQLELAPLIEAGAAPLLARAMRRAWELLAARDAFTYAPPAKKEKGADEEEEAPPAADETEEQRRMRAAAEEAVAEANVSFDENWNSFLNRCYRKGQGQGKAAEAEGGGVVPREARAAVALAAALVQLLAREVSGSGSQGAKDALPPAELLRALAASEDATLAAAGAALLATADGAPDAPVFAAQPALEDLELALFARACHSCAKLESRDLKLLRCAACGGAAYCSSACQKHDWKLGHKGVCKALAEARAKLAAAGAAAGAGAAAAGNEAEAAAA